MNNWIRTAIGMKERPYCFTCGMETPWTSRKMYYHVDGDRVAYAHDNVDCYYTAKLGRSANWLKEPPEKIEARERKKRKHWKKQGMTYYRKSGGDAQETP